MKTINKFLSVLILFTILVTTSCLKDGEPAPNVPKAALRMVNAFSYAESIIFTQDNNYITPPNAPLKYSEYTNSLAFIFPGNKRLKIYDTQNKLVSDTTITLKDSTFYTSFVFGNTEKAKNLITTDVSLTNIGTNVAIRFLHLASNLANVNVHVGQIGTPIYENRAPELLSTNTSISNAGFKAQKSGKQKIIITDTNNVVLIEREYDFIQSRYYSIILIGDNKSTTKPLYLGIINQ